MSDYLDIKNVKPDYDENKHCTLLNPLDTDFYFTFGAKGPGDEPYYTVPAKGFLYLNEPIAMTGARRISDVIIRQNRKVDLEDLYRRLGGKEKLADQQKEFLLLQTKAYSPDDKEKLMKLLVVDEIIEKSTVPDKLKEVNSEIKGEPKITEPPLEETIVKPKMGRPKKNLSA
jgi:hypothetical protein